MKLVLVEDLETEPTVYTTEDFSIIAVILTEAEKEAVGQMPPGFQLYAHMPTSFWKENQKKADTLLSKIRGEEGYPEEQAIER